MQLRNPFRKKKVVAPVEPILPVIPAQQLQHISFFRDFQRFLVDGETDMFADEPTANRLIKEFFDILKSPKGKTIDLLHTKIGKTSVRLDETNILIRSLERYYDPFIAELLKTKLQYRYQFTEQSYLADIASVMREAHTQGIKLKELISQVNKVVEDGENEKTTYNSLTQTTLAINKFLGYPLPADTDARTWAISRKEFSDHLEKAQQDARRISK